MSDVRYILLAIDGGVVTYAVKTRDGWRVYKAPMVNRGKVTS